MKHPFIAPVDVHKLTRLYESVHKLAAKHFPLTVFGNSLIQFDWHRLPEWRLALVTSTHREIVETMPQLNAMDWLFVGGRTGKGTNKKSQILSCMNTYDVITSDIIYVGDAPSDEALAKELRVPFYDPREPDVLYRITGLRKLTGTIFDKTPMPTEGMFRSDSPSRLMGS
jgi:hypothetical protein